MKRLLVIVNPQNDFVTPEGSMYTPGSEGVLKNIYRYIRKTGDRLDDILVLSKSYQRLYPGFSSFWKETPETGTRITRDMMLSGTYTPGLPLRESPEEILITPEHCIIGSTGHGFPSELVDVLGVWSVLNKRLVLHNEPLREDDYSEIVLSGFRKDDDIVSVINGVREKNKLVFFLSGMAGVRNYNPSPVYQDCIDNYGARVLE